MPQNKKTKPVEAGADLPDLTPQEIRLVEAKAQGLDNTAAYKVAYDAAGYSQPALRVQACRKFAEPKIQKYLLALRGAAFTNSSLTLDGRVEDELAFAAKCEAAGNLSAAGQAYDRVNKMKGFYVERYMEVSRDPTEIMAEIQREFGAEVANTIQQSMSKH